MSFLFFFPQERKEFEQRFSKEQGAMREQLQVSSDGQMHKLNLIGHFWHFLNYVSSRKDGVNCNVNVSYPECIMPKFLMV